MVSLVINTYVHLHMYVNDNCSGCVGFICILFLLALLFTIVGHTYKHVCMYEMHIWIPLHCIVYTYVHTYVAKQCIYINIRY